MNANADDTIVPIINVTATVANRLATARLRFAHIQVLATVPIRRDYDLLKQAASAEGWTDDTPIPPSFFALHTEFPVDEPNDRGSILEIASAVDARLLELFAKAVAHTSNGHRESMAATPCVVISKNALRHWK